MKSRANAMKASAKKVLALSRPQPRFTRDESRARRTRSSAPCGGSPFRMFLVPCSCGTTFAVAENYDRQGTAWGRYMICPGCGKRHDPKNRLLQMGFHPEGYWKVEDC